MSYCTNCGVELDDDLLSCPLCGFKVGNTILAESGGQSGYYPSDIIQLHKEETGKHIPVVAAGGIYDGSGYHIPVSGCVFRANKAIAGSGGAVYCCQRRRDSRR